MRPVVRASLALAALAALTGPLGSAPRTRIVSATPGPSSSSRSKPATDGADLSAVCPVGQLPDGEICVPFDRAALRAPVQNGGPEGAPPLVARGGGGDQIPRREGRPANLDAYRLPAAALASAPRLDARGGLEADVPAGTAVLALSLDRQEGIADVLAIEPVPAALGGSAGFRVFTHHVVREGETKAEIVLAIGPLASVRDGLAVGARVADGDRLGVTAATPSTLRVESRRLRDGLDIASLAGPNLLAEDRAVRLDPRNVLPLR